MFVASGKFICIANARTAQAAESWRVLTIFDGKGSKSGSALIGNGCMRLKTMTGLLTVWAVMGTAPALAQAVAQSVLSAKFTRGAIAEYTNNPNGTDKGVLLSSLSIASITINQTSANGLWGGSQGNDTAVTATITFNNGSPGITFPAAINWVKNAGGGNFDWVGLTIGGSTSVNDGYALDPGFSKTYILQFPQSSLSLSTLLPNGLDGSANTGAALNALNQNFPNATTPVISGPTGGAGAANSAVSVNENQTGATTLSADKAVTWAITGGNDAGKFTINSSGVITFNSAPDFEAPTDSDTNNTYILTVTATDANGNTATQTVTVTVLNLDDTAPVIAAGQSFAYAENQAANATVGTVAATDAVGVTGFRFAATGTTTSADTYYVIDAAGVIRLTAAGAAAGAPTNDFETAPNSFTYGIEARDAVGNWSAARNVTLAVTDLNDVAPVITGPSGGAGSPDSAISVNEGTTAVTTLTSNTPVTWAITGGNDAGRFQVSPSGAITFVTAPDFEAPADSDTNNAYVLTLTGTDANGNAATQTVTVTVLDLADTAPVITGPSGGAGAPASAISVNEGTTAVTTLTSNTPVTWAITGGNDAGRFQVSPSGAITFVTAPDFEAPADSDTNNAYVLTLTGTDANGNAATPTVTVTVLDRDDTPPVITIPGVAPGGTAGAQTISVVEGQSAVTTLIANETVSWTIAGGNDGGRFAITPSGAITFAAAPDFDAPTDSDTNNAYVLTVQATDAAGNQVRQSITVLVTDLDDSAPVITGPSGTPGATTSAIIVTEGQTIVATLTANETVAWAITGGSDAGRFAISPSGAITFLAAPDFEAPNDGDTNNTYILQVRATDRNGNISTQTITVAVANIDEIARRLGEIGGPLRGDLRNHAFSSLSNMLAFNETLLADSDRDGNCSEPDRQKPVSGRVDADEASQAGAIDFNRQLNACGSRTRIYGNGGLAMSRLDGNWTTRALASVKVEYNLNDTTVLGAGVLGSFASDELARFDDSQIEDQSVQLNLYARTRLTESLRLAAFGGVGKAWYDFSLVDETFVATGKMSGTRHFYGAALSGDIRLGGIMLTTDAILSHAVERLGNATLAASYLGENRSGIAFGVGAVDATRLSIPVHVPISLGTDASGISKGRLDFSPGLLCEDTSAASSSLQCGYQLGVKALFAPSGKLRITGEARHEQVEGFRTELFSIGFMRRFGPLDMASIGFDVQRGMRDDTADDRVMLTLKVGK